MRKNLPEAEPNLEVRSNFMSNWFQNCILFPEHNSASDKVLSSCAFINYKWGMAWYLHLEWSRMITYSQNLFIVQRELVRLSLREHRIIEVGNSLTSSHKNHWQGKLRGNWLPLVGKGLWAMCSVGRSNIFSLKKYYPLNTLYFYITVGLLESLVITRIYSLIRIKSKLFKKQNNFYLFPRRSTSPHTRARNSHNIHTRPMSQGHTTLLINQ